MDNYFKAAVCDLDKLLDEFEENADENDCFRTAPDQCNSKHHLLSSGSDYLKPVSLTPKVQEHDSSYTISEEIFFTSQVATNEANFEQPHFSSPNEKNVTGLDLLSTVDSGASDEIQPSSLGRGSIPVCDLINDTGNVICAASSQDDIQKSQSEGFQYTKDSLIGFDLPAAIHISSIDYSDVSSTVQQRSGDLLVQDVGHLATKELSQLALKTNVAKVKHLDSCGDQTRTHILKSDQAFDELEQITGLTAASLLITSQTLNVLSSKDNTTNENLPRELLDKNACCVISQEVQGGCVDENIDSEDEGNVESVSSDLPKNSELHKSSIELSRKSVLADSSFKIEDKVVSDSIKRAEENLGRPKLKTNELLNSVSASHALAEEVQTSLSCFPLAVSICGSLVVQEDTNGPIFQDERVDVVRDTVTLHAGRSSSGLHNKERYEKTESSEQEEYLNQSCLEKNGFTPEEKGDTTSMINKDNALPVKATASVFPITESKPEFCTDIQQVDGCVESIANLVLNDIAIEEDFLKNDTLISDAELDAFLNEQCLQPNIAKPLEENIGDLLESDAIQINLIHTNSPDFKKGNDTETKIKLKEIREVPSISSTCRIADVDYKFECPTEQNTSVIQQEITQTNSEVPVPNVPIGGARPKQLPSLPQKTVDQRDASKANIPESEPPDVNSVFPKAPFSDTKVSPDISSKCNHSDIENSLEAGENQIPAGVEAVVLGQKQPSWVPDSEAPNCMNCQVKFTFTKRRHHCRACGKVFCGICCNRRCKLQYMEKEARVCIGCYKSINKAQAFERMMSPTGPNPNSSISSECCSAVQPFQEAHISSTPNSVLKQPSVEGPCPREQRRVWFADGILPNGEVADTTKLSSGVKRSSQDQSPVNSDLPETHTVENPVDDFSVADVKPTDEMHITLGPEKLPCASSVVPDDGQLPSVGQMEILQSSQTVVPDADELLLTLKAEKSPPTCIIADQPYDDLPVSPSDYRILCGIEKCVSKEISLIPDDDDGFPPLLLGMREKGEGPVVEEHPSHQQVTSLLSEGELNPLTFILNANFLVNVKLLSYSLEKCWYFSTNGLHSLGQAEIIILLLCLPNEDAVPKEIFRLFVDIYKNAMKGKFIGNLENFTFTESFLGNRDHGGFLFVTPTFQKLDNLTLPNNPFLCGILIHKLEIPWAKVFPIRLMLRLGAEYGVYPTPVMSIRHRKSLFGEIGNTIMNLLVDLRNYQYTLHTIDNLFIHMEMGRSCIKIPLRKYNEVMKVINSSNEHVISIGACFSTEADSHLVCIQSDDGAYQTQANSGTGHPRRGASFVVFNGALKSSSGFLAKSSIVEDGLMVQITAETMEGLRQALRDKKDFKITCGKLDAGDLREYVDICWVESEEKVNKGVISPVDGKSMEGIWSEKLLQGRDFEAEGKVIKCTEVFYFLKDHELSDLTSSQFAKDLAIACSTTLCPHLKMLKNNGMNKIGLRVSIDTDMVEYQAGSGGYHLPQHYLNELDGALIPVIHGGSSDPTSLPLEMELIFFLTESLS
ncbi:zinc finger FYVE domain-containing protein 16 isoform X2 [Alligator mississippiensis]|uniref:zinc finger FYVE domain-containing protein 16 isoform X2 n=1 Tax=Alligator mississippiensis TaxID=8496 RepID=UPI0006EC90BA|nr:zinc finger FYVE domain-containing protein 16 isoform X2 [Alligator mississippiensis]